MSFNLKLNKIINFFKTSYKNKNVLVKYKKNKMVLQILENFLNENVINGFYEEGGYYYIYLKYNNLGEPIIKNIIKLYKRPFTLPLTIKQLKNKSFVKKYISFYGEKSSICVFSTNNGICSYNNCIKNNTGGVALFIVVCV